MSALETDLPFTDKIDAYQQTHRRAGFPIAVLYKFLDDNGGHLAALITYYGFLSLFPLLYLGTSVLGLILQGNPVAQQAVLHSALSQFPAVGKELARPEHLGGGTLGLILGTIGALYGGLGVTVAVQSAMNTAWSVPRNLRPNPLAARGRGLLLLLTVGLTILGTTVLVALGGGAAGNEPAVRALFIASSVGLNAVAFTIGFRIATARRLTTRNVLPGACAAAISWEIIQLVGKRYITRVVAHTSATNSVFALVLGLIAFLYLEAVTVMLCVVANAVRVDKLWPRSLLTPLTDAVILTPGDERAYTAQAKAQRAKGFQQIDVTFDKPTRPAGTE